MKQYVYICLSLLLCIPGCSWFDSAQGGDVVTQNRITADEKNKRIKEITMQGNGTVILSSDEHTTVDIEGPEAEMKNVEATIHDGHLSIKSSAKGPLTLYVMIDKDHYSDVEDINLSGAIDFKTQYPIGRERLEIEAVGSCKVKIAVDVEALEITGNDSAQFDIDGQAVSQKVELKNASHYHAGSLITEEAEIDGSGSTRFMMNVSDSIKGSLVGASILSYRGAPKIQVTTSGAASVTKVD